MSGIILKPTDIVLLPFPFPDLTSTKKRPVLVIKELDNLNDFVALPITSQSHHTMSIAISNADLMKGSFPKDSWVKTDKIFTFNQKIVVGRIAEVKTEFFSKILAQICDYLGCCK